ncbi:ATP-grasp domain-containing protein [Salinispora arenicola]|uniref:ATP-grasp domain-containing protein n=1 Tax=Salinispora arenicola TaxID=168697 RepID=UPI0003826B51|nr:ATP-grasp domain-containing protein [Salinispora arenicola]
MKRIAVIGGTVNILHRARKLGVGVVLFHRAGAYDPASRKLCDELVEVDFSDDYPALEREVLARHQARPFDRVMSLTERGLVPAARLNEQLGLGGNLPSVAEILRNKPEMRRILNAAGISPVRYRVVQDPAGLAEFMQEVGGPVIVKPVDGSASEGVFRIDPGMAVDGRWPQFPGGRGGPLLAEEALEGPEFSVDAYSWRGEHHVITITRKLLDDAFLEIGHSMPSRLDPHVAKETTGTVRQMLDAVGLVEGPSHTELRLTPGGPRIIESHNRIGGSRLFELMGLAYDIDLIEMTVAVPLGLMSPPSADPEPMAAAAVRYFVPEPGVVRAIDGTASLPTDGSVGLALGVAVGDAVPHQRTSVDRDRLGCYVVARGSDEDDAIQRCNDVLDSVSIVTSPASAGSRAASDQPLRPVAQPS